MLPLNLKVLTTKTGSSDANGYQTPAQVRLEQSQAIPLAV
jgi:hypothetical protein